MQKTNTEKVSSEITETFLRNKSQFSHEESWNKMLEELKYQIGFVDFLSDILLDKNNIVVSAEYIFQFEKIIYSAKLTLQSIYFCLENGNIADGFELIRKFRDTLLLYLIFKDTFDKDRESYFKSTTKKETKIKQLKKWLNDETINVDISKYFLHMLNSDTFTKFNKEFEVAEKYKRYNKKLNKHVHNLKISYLNYNYSHYKMTNTYIEDIAKEINSIIAFFTLLFLTMLTLLNPSNMSSSDYLDQLEMGLIPDENSKYFVAPLISEYFNKNKNIFGPNLCKFIRNTTDLEL